MEGKLIRIDKNGSKHFEGLVTCSRCNGTGVYIIGTRNGEPVLSPRDGGVCYKCGGSGKMMAKWIERTPEYQAKLDARRQARQEEAARRAEEARKAAEEAKRKAEAERMAKKAISQYVGEIGQRVTIEATYVRSAWYEAKSFAGYGTETRYIHIFVDADGNKIVWKTGSVFEIPDGSKVIVKGTVKAHEEYKDEKQTILTRCKVEEA